MTDTRGDMIRQNIWERAGGRRRLRLLLLIVIPSLLAAHAMYTLLPARAGLFLNGVCTALFALLFSWISVGFWSSAAGLMVMLRRRDRFAVTRGLPGAPDASGGTSGGASGATSGGATDASGGATDASGGAPLPDGVRTALLFPVYHEDPRAVCEGIRLVLRSLRERKLDSFFDIFILSDSTRPDAWVAEEEAWHALCRDEDAFGRVFYRRRRSNLKRKSGNIADFCRRWGAKYRYMTVFDADSLMSGDTLRRMVLAMEAHPEIGILQSPPKTVNSRSLIARVQQFSNHLYGPIFAAGFHYWQLGDAQYWGHNAIIRTEPFMRYCQLPRLPGSAPLGGDILSHDFVESALMRRAGYGVWLAYELDGSYEECPPSLIDELIRDRRWCQGNLQHSRLIFTRGFFPTHRALFINGIMSYGSALLWFLFLLASSAQVMAELFVVPDYFPTGPSLFPDWPRYFPSQALALLGGTATLLFLPKLLALALVTARGGAGAFGGTGPMLLSALGEVLVSTFLAPVRMLFHSVFVISTLFGRTVGWNAQNRGGQGTSWRDALRFHWWGALLGLLWGLVMYRLNPGFFLWLSPIVAGLALSVPLSVWTSRVSLGDAARALGLFVTPVDSCPPPDLERLRARLAAPEPYCPFDLPREKGFARAVVIPAVFALHSTLNATGRRNSPRKKARLAALVDRALAGGPDALGPAEKSAILSDPESLARLHRQVWELPPDRAAAWGIR